MQRSQASSGYSTYTTTLTEQELDERTAEIADTLMDVASITKGSPKHMLPSSLPVGNPAKQEPLRFAASRPSNKLATSTLPLFTTIFSTIGFGIDGDATEAAVKAVRDAVERGMLLSALPEGRHHKIHIQLGVPLNPEHQQLVRVDSARLAQLLPTCASLQPIEMQVGGLLVPSPQATTLISSDTTHATCVVVACISVQNANSVPKANPEHQPPRSAIGSPNSVKKTPVLAATSQVVAPLQKRRMVLPLRHQATTSKALSAHGFRLHHNDLPRVPTSWEEVERSQEPEQSPRLPVDVSTTTNQTPRRTNSIEMLAHISAAMIGQQLQEQQHLGASMAMTYNSNEDRDEGEGNEEEEGMRSTFKKLPPGKTPKNNLRHFVRHSYRDHSHEVPASEEIALVGPNAPSRTPNASFPLKLHEILTQIERNGYDNIIGWLPHGRSFKIHRQKEFVDTILPMYFVMTKKSSFLRQLNLYGFNRISDGSYYHESFLRGMKFLTRRMQRQKVNGNGIRAAGNPDDEPVLSRFPVCPPVKVGMQGKSSKVDTKERDFQLNSNTDGSNDRGTSNGSGKRSALEGSHRLALGRASPDADTSRSRQDAAVAMVRASQNPADPVVRGKNGHHQASFPFKLQRILDKLEAEGNTDVLSWLSHGRAFIVHDADRFVKELLPVYFHQTKYSSFQRQCHMYNFTRITHGRDKGAYFNLNFQRARPELSKTIQRTRVNGKGTRRPGNPHEEPDLYALPPLPVVEPGTTIELPPDLPTAIQHSGLAAWEGSTSGSASGEED